ncbi:unnamed protein product [Rhizopus stolonifer]
MKILLLFSIFVSVSYALINDIDEDCIVINPIGNTIVTAGEKMKVQWSNSHTEKFGGIYLVQSDGNQTPIKIASDLPTIPNKVIIDLPWNLTPSNAYYMTLGEPPFHCTSGNLRILKATSAPPPPNNPFNKGTSPTLGVYPKEEAGVEKLEKSFLITVLGFVFIILQSMFMRN